MGLDTTHDCWHGPYSMFMRWRVAIAEVAGFGDIYALEGFSRTTWRGDEPGTRAWPSHVLTELLHHSDCDGEIPWRNAYDIANALEELIPKLELRDSITGVKGKDTARAIYDGTANATRRFIVGLRLAQDLRENVEFH